MAKAKYNHPEIGDLARQMAYLAKEVRIAQLQRAERLICLTEPDKSYPYEFVCYQVTGYRPRSDLGESLGGKTLREDLGRLVEHVSAGLKMGAEEVGEPVYTIKDAAERFNVSQKTIQRWRRQGLVAWKFQGEDGRTRVGLRASSLERFANQNAGRVEEAGAFSRLNTEERREIIRRARRLSLFCHCCLFEVSKRIARKLGRAVETVRQTIKQYDQENPNKKLFPNATEALQDTDRRRIYQAYQRGVSVHALAKRFCRTRSSIYRIITEERARDLLQEPIEYMDSREFHRKNADSVVLNDPVAREVMAGADSGAKTPPKGLPIYLKNLYKTPLLSKEEERSLFRLYNYLKFKATLVRERLAHTRSPKVEDIEVVERLLDEAARVKNRIVQSNLRLVVNIAKRHVSAQANFFELISDGNMSLLRAVDKFDYTRGFKFSTYASWAIMKNFARTVPKAGRRRERFMTGHDELLEMTEDLRFEGEEPYREPDVTVKESIERVLGELGPREREIVMRRFGLGDMPGPQTLEEVGKHFGVTKERIRQIEGRALKKLRGMLSPKALEEITT